MTAAPATVPVTALEILATLDRARPGRGPADVAKLLGTGRDAAVNAIGHALRDPSVRRTPSARRWTRLLWIADRRIVGHEITVEDLNDTGYFDRVVDFEAERARA